MGFDLAIPLFDKTKEKEKKIKESLDEVSTLIADRSAMMDAQIPQSSEIRIVQDVRRERVECVLFNA